MLCCADSRKEIIFIAIMSVTECISVSEPPKDCAMRINFLVPCIGISGKKFEQIKEFLHSVAENFGDTELFGMAMFSDVLSDVRIHLVNKSNFHNALDWLELPTNFALNCNNSKRLLALALSETRLEMFSPSNTQDVQVLVVLMDGPTQETSSMKTRNPMKYDISFIKDAYLSTGFSIFTLLVSERTRSDFSVMMRDMKNVGYSGIFLSKNFDNLLVKPPKQLARAVTLRCWQTAGLQGRDVQKTIDKLVESGYFESNRRDIHATFLCGESGFSYLSQTYCTDASQHLLKAKMFSGTIPARFSEAKSYFHCAHGGSYCSNPSMACRRTNGLCYCKPPTMEYPDGKCTMPELVPCGSSGLKCPDPLMTCRSRLCACPVNKLKYNNSCKDSTEVPCNTVDRGLKCPEGQQRCNVQRSGRKCVCRDLAQRVMVYGRCMEKTIMKRPRVIENPRDQVLREGQNAVFDCIVTGMPKPVISWWKGKRSYYHDHYPVKLNTSIEKYRTVNEGSRLIISRVHPTDDADLYHCQVKNLHGADMSGPAHLRVIYLAAKSLNSDSPQDFYSSPGKAIKIPCEPLHDSYPVQSIAYTLGPLCENGNCSDGKPISETSLVQVIPVTRETKLSGIAGAIVFTNPQMHDFLNSSTYLYCGQTNNVLGVTLMGRGKRFMYEASRTDMPLNTPRLFYPDGFQQKNVEVDAGDKFILKFIFVGDPTPKVKRWEYPTTLDPSKIKDGHLPNSKIFMDAGPDHEGTYTGCAVFFFEHEICGHYNVKVRYPPTFLDGEPKDVNVTRGGTGSVSCKGVPTHPQTSLPIWYTNTIQSRPRINSIVPEREPNVIVSLGTKIEFLNMQKSWMIQCVLVNALGYRIRTATIKTMEPIKWKSDKPRGNVVLRYLDEVASVELKCHAEVDAEEKLTTRWFLNVPINHTSSLPLTEYELKSPAFSYSGDDRSVLTIDIRYPQPGKTPEEAYDGMYTCLVQAVYNPGPLSSLTARQYVLFPRTGGMRRCLKCKLDVQEVTRVVTVSPGDCSQMCAKGLCEAAQWQMSTRECLMVAPGVPFQTATDWSNCCEAFFKKQHVFPDMIRVPNRRLNAPRTTTLSTQTGYICALNCHEVSCKAAEWDPVTETCTLVDNGVNIHLTDGNGVCCEVYRDLPGVERKRRTKVSGTPIQSKILPITYECAEACAQNSQCRMAERNHLTLECRIFDERGQTVTDSGCCDTYVKSNYPFSGIRRNETSTAFTSKNTTIMTSSGYECAEMCQARSCKTAVYNTTDGRCSLVDFGEDIVPTGGIWDCCEVYIDVPGMTRKNNQRILSSGATTTLTTETEEACYKACSERPCEAAQWDRTTMECTIVPPGVDYQSIDDGEDGCCVYYEKEDEPLPDVRRIPNKAIQSSGATTFSTSSDFECNERCFTMNCVVSQFDYASRICTVVPEGVDYELVDNSCCTVYDNRAPPGMDKLPNQAIETTEGTRTTTPTSHACLSQCSRSDCAVAQWNPETKECLMVGEGDNFNLVKSDCCVVGRKQEQPFTDMFRRPGQALSSEHTRTHVTDTGNECGELCVRSLCPAAHWNLMTLDCVVVDPGGDYAVRNDECCELYEKEEKERIGMKAYDNSAFDSATNTETYLSSSGPDCASKCAEVGCIAAQYNRQTKECVAVGEGGTYTMKADSCCTTFESDVNVVPGVLQQERRRVRSNYLEKVDAKSAEECAQLCQIMTDCLISQWGKDECQVVETGRTFDTVPDGCCVIFEKFRLPAAKKKVTTEYGRLWPAIIVIAMVVILCAAVFFYVRRRRKLRASYPLLAGLEEELDILIINLEDAIESGDAAAIQSALCDYEIFVKEHHDFVDPDKALVKEAMEVLLSTGIGNEKLFCEQIEIKKLLQRAMDANDVSAIEKALARLKEFSKLHPDMSKLCNDQDLIKEAEARLVDIKKEQVNVKETEVQLKDKLRQAIDSRDPKKIDAAIYEYECFLCDHRGIVSPDQNIIKKACDALDQIGPGYGKVIKKRGELKRTLMKALKGRDISGSEIALKKLKEFVAEYPDVLSSDEDFIRECECSLDELKSKGLSLKPLEALLQENLKKALDAKIVSSVHDALHKYNNFLKENRGLVKPNHDLIKAANTFLLTNGSSYRKHAAQLEDRRRELEKAIATGDLNQIDAALEKYKTVAAEFGEDFQVDNVLFSTAEDIIRSKLKDKQVEDENFRSELQRVVVSNNISEVQALLHNYEKFLKEYDGFIDPDNKLISAARTLINQQSGIFRKHVKEIERLQNNIENAMKTGDVAAIRKAIEKYREFGDHYKNEIGINQPLLEKAEMMVREKEMQMQILGPKHDQLKDQLERALNEHDSEAVQVALRNYEQFVKENVSMIEPCVELVKRGKDFLKNPDLENKNLHKELDHLAQNLKHAIANGKLSAIESALDKYNEFAKRHRDIVSERDELLKEADKTVKEKKDILKEVTPKYEAARLQLSSALSTHSLAQVKESLVVIDDLSKANKDICDLVQSDMSLIKEARDAVKHGQQDEKKLNKDFERLTQELKHVLGSKNLGAIENALGKYRDFIETHKDVLKADEKLLKMAERCIHERTDAMNTVESRHQLLKEQLKSALSSCHFLEVQEIVSGYDQMVKDERHLITPDAELLSQAKNFLASCKGDAKKAKNELDDLEKALKKALGGKDLQKIQDALSKYKEFANRHQNEIVANEKLIGQVENTLVSNIEAGDLKKALVSAVESMDENLIRNALAAYSDLAKDKDKSVSVDKNLLSQANRLLNDPNAIKRGLEKELLLVLCELSQAASTQNKVRLREGLLKIEEFKKRNNGRVSVDEGQIEGYYKMYAEMERTEERIAAEHEDLKRKLVGVQESHKYAEVKSVLAEYESFIEGYKMRIQPDEGLIHRTRERLKDLRKSYDSINEMNEELKHKLQEVLDEFDCVAIQDALTKYEEFGHIYVLQFDIDHDLVKQARNTLIEMQKMKKEEVQEHNSLKEALAKAVAAMDEDLINQAIADYEKFISKHKPSLCIDRNLLNDANNMMLAIEDREKLHEAIEAKDGKQLKKLLRIIDKLGVDTAIFKELAKARILCDGLDTIDRLKEAIFKLDRSKMSEIRDYAHPPENVHEVMVATLLILGDPESETRDWQTCQKRCATIRSHEYDGLLKRIKEYDFKHLNPEIAARGLEVIKRHTRHEIFTTSHGAAIFYDWTLGMCEQCLQMCEIKPKAAVGLRQRHILAEAERQRAQASTTPRSLSPQSSPSPSRRLVTPAGSRKSP